MNPTHMFTVVCASANPDKVVEIQALLHGAVNLLPRPAGVADVVEDADTLEGNARLKASAICLVSAMPAVSDDTGLFVDALDGAPGVITARYAGQDATYSTNRAKLLAELIDYADGPNRSARFETVAMVVWPNGREVAVRGVCHGRIAVQELGDLTFGYNALFIPDDGDGRTFGQMTAAEKNAISHRGRAFSALVEALRTTRVDVGN